MSVRQFIMKGATQAVIRAVYPYGATRKIVRGDLNGMKFEVAPAMGFTYALGLYPLPFHLFRELILPGSVIYDVGANRGQVMLFFAKIAGEKGKVFCFEPVKELCDGARRNIELNNLENVEAYEVAVSDSNGETDFFFSRERPTGGRLQNARESGKAIDLETMKVRKQTLDSFVQNHPPPDFIKIDVEGGGQLALKGMTRILETHRPTIYMELHCEEEKVAAKTFLQGAGYTLFEIDGRVIDDPTEGWHDPIVGRYLAK